MQAFAIVVSLALTAVAAVLTVIAVRRVLSVIRAGQPIPGRSDHPGSRLWTVFKETVLHTRMLQWTWVGIAHWCAFAAFIFLSTAVGSAYFQLFDPSWTIPVAGRWFVYEWFAELLGLLGTIGIIPLIVYRLRNMPKDKGRKTRFFGSTMWQAFFVEAMVLLESSAILFIRGAEYNLALARGGQYAEHARAFHFPVAQFFGNLYPTGAENIDTIENIIYAIAAFKIVTAMIWLIVIATNLTMGVAWHRFTAWFNIFYKREGTGRDTDGKTLALGAMKPMLVGGAPVTLEDVEEDRVPEDAVLGAGTIHDFSWKGILDFTTCTECGRCQSQCPAWNTEKPLSPKLLVMGLREHAYAAAPYRNGDGENALAEKALVGSGAGSPEQGASTEVADWFYNPEGADYVIDEDVLWSCTSCGACVQQCPVDIEHVDHIMDMRRYQVLVESNFPSELNGLFKGLEGKGNPWNMNANARMDWAKDLPFDVKVVGDDIESLDEVDWLFWVGCAGAYEDRAKKTTRAVAELLDLAGVSFGVLGNGETCTGDSARRAGNEFLFQGLAQQNIETFKEFKVKKVVSTCAHCFNTLKNEYKDFGIELEVIHHTQLLNRLVREGKLTPVASGAGAHQRSITYHDPCFIGRHNGVYSPPRELLQVLPGAEYKEMPRNSERSFCCGAGGARMWMEEKLGSRINRNRTDEAVATGADQIAVGCPFCRVMLSDGLTAAQADGTARESVEVLDVAQMLLASVRGEMATKLAPGTPGEPVETAPTASSVAVAAEPSQGDVTVTDSTVTETADAGPAAKASGGSSLFDTPASTESAPDDASSLFDTPAPAEPPAPAEDKAAGSGGGSLFDISGDEAPAAERPAEAAQPAEPAAEPAADLGSGGSLFDVQPTAPESSAAEAPAPAEPAAPAEAGPAAPAEAGAQAEAAAPAEPSVDLGSGGSLFDIPAQTEAPAPSGEQPSEPAAQSAAGSPADSPAPAGAAGGEATPEPVTPAAEAPVASSGVASAPRSDVDIDAASSLFDIEAPEGAVAAAPAAPAGQTAAVDQSAPVQEPAAAEPEDGSTETPAAAQTAPVAEPAPATEQPPATTEASAAQAPAAETEVTETPAAPAPTAAPAASSGTTSTPRTDVEIESVGSLFDIEAPEGSVVAAAVPAAPEQPSQQPNEAPSAPAESPVEEAPSTLAAEEAAPVTPEAAAEAASAPAEVPSEEATSTLAAEGAAPVTPDAVEEVDAVDQEPPGTDDEAPAEPRSAADGAPSSTPAPASSGEAHAPRTDVDIHGAGSLFDL